VYFIFVYYTVDKAQQLQKNQHDQL